MKKIFEWLKDWNRRNDEMFAKKEMDKMKEIQKGKFYLEVVNGTLYIVCNKTAVEAIDNATSVFSVIEKLKTKINNSIKFEIDKNA